MSFLWAKVEKEFQFCLKFLGPNVIVLRNSDLLLIVEHVDNNSPSLRVYLQKKSFKNKVKQVNEQKLGSKVDLQKLKIKHVEEQKLGSKVDLQKGESRTCRRAKTRFKRKFAKGESRTCRRRINIKHTSWNCRSDL